jgi:brefeldin A-resistance guanine nucleotide exchange factor 1
VLRWLLYFRLLFVQDKSASNVGNQVDGNGDLSHFEGVETPSGNASEEGSSRLSYSGKREDGNSRSVVVTDQSTAIEPYGIPCMVEIFSFLCSLLNIADPQSPGQALLASDEDVPHFALLLINSSIELGGESFSRHPKLLALVQDELFRNLMLMGLSPNPLVLSMVCGIVLNLYHHLRSAVKLQLEAFFSYVLIRLASGKYGATHQQQEVAMEALVDFCRQPTFMPEMYANFDCDITLSNTFEDLGNLLSKSAFPVNCPLSAMHVLALEGILAVVHSMADRVDSAAPALTSSTLSGAMVVENQDYIPFWTLKCENYQDPGCWIEYLKHQKYIKRRLMIGADHFNRDPKKGLEFLQGIRLLPAKLDPKSVACFFR